MTCKTCACSNCVVHVIQCSKKQDSIFQLLCYKLMGFLGVNKYNSFKVTTYVEPKQSSILFLCQRYSVSAGLFRP